MASKSLRKGLQRNSLTIALGLCFVGGVQAQSNTGGALMGHAASGDTVTIASPSTGFSRTISVDSNGNYRFAQLPIGEYTVTRKGADGTTASRSARVSVGSAANVDFVSASTSGGTTTLDTVTVVGTAVNPIDVSSVESTTILTAEQIARIPVPRDATSVALLAPGTVRGDSAFGNLASFGGSSVSENAYFVNGFNVTNAFQNLNFAQVPWEGIAEQQVKTGGYGAEFGRSTGGVINQITRRGSNTFHAGGNIFWSPRNLRSTNPDQFNNNGQLIADNSKDRNDSQVESVWASGALIKDRLFGYVLVQQGRTTADFYPGRGGQNRNEGSKSPKYLAKVDWNISDSHHLEYTGMVDNSDTETNYYTTTFPNRDPLDPNDVDASDPTRDQYLGTGFDSRGSRFNVLKYTGYFGDSFTLSALAGRGEFERSNYSVAANGVRNEYFGNVGGEVSGCPIITDARPGVQAGTQAPIVGCSLADFLGRADAKDTRDQFRLDAEWQLGDHLLRGGVDIDNFESVAGTSYSGGASWRYGRYQGQDNIVRKRVFQSGATVAVDQRAFYIEDHWNITNNLTGYLGLRWDTFDNKNGAGQTFAKIENQFAPRLGLSWDVFGDNTFKVFGNAGRYALPLTATVAVRGASASLFSEEYFTYTGVDPTTGAPTGLVQIINPSTGTLTRYLNNEFGVAKDPSSIASQNLKPMYQDEYILGFQKQMTDDVTLGVRGIYRDLKQAIDDQCDYRPIYQYAIDNGLEFNPYNPGFAFCHLYNPGSDGIFNVDVDGDGTLEQITIPADVLGPKAKRSYTALEFFGEATFDRGFIQGSYTYARNKGNTEGGVKSDNGQSDTGTTQDFDYPELTIGSYGYLPNDRRHTLKVFGNFDITNQWSVGANVLIQSGRPENCFGFLGGFDTARYGNSYFSCDPGPTDDNADNGSTIVNRGTAGRTPWTKSLDLNVAYRPAFAADKLMFKVDVFNVLNSRDATSINEEGEDSGGNPDPTNYKVATGWQQPRQVRFMVQYDF